MSASNDRLTDDAVANWAGISYIDQPFAPSEMVAGRLAREVQSERAWRKRIADCDPALVEAVRAKWYESDESPGTVQEIFAALAAVQKEQNDG